MEFDKIIDAIEDNFDLHETLDIEFKSAKGGFPGAFWETYSSFANTEGGLIVLGITERKGKFFVDGLSEDDIKKYKTIFWNQCHSRETISECFLANNGCTEVKSQRLSATQRRIEILNYTDGVFRSASEIAKAFSLSIDYTQRKFISPMVKEGMLQPLHPNKGTHPYQKYSNAKSKSI